MLPPSASAAPQLRSTLDRPPRANHPLVSQVSGRTVELTVGGDPEVASEVLAAYRVASGGDRWDSGAGTTTLDRATADRAAQLGQLIAHASMADYERSIPPGPVVAFTGASLVLDLRSGDPGDDGRAVEAIATGSRSSTSQSAKVRTARS